MWAELGHHSPCIFGTLQETKVFDFEGQAKEWASPHQAGHHGETTACKDPKQAVLFARAKASVSGQPSVPAMAADICMAQSASGSTPHPLQVFLLQRISHGEESWGQTPLRLRLQECFPWWEKHAPHGVVQLIMQGVQQDFPLPAHLSRSPPPKTGPDLVLAQSILQDYQKSGAVRLVTDPQNTRHLVPWFIISKQESGGLKHRFITDRRELNQFLQPKEFKLDHLNAIYPYLKKGWVAAKVDLKDAYFHLSLSSTLSQFVRVQVGGVEWEFLSACFGLSTLPQLFM